MKTKQTYFGLEFPLDFPLDQTTCHRLAILLYANPSTSPEEAIRILRNHNLWLTIDQLLQSLQIEVKKIAQIDLDDFKVANVRLLLYNKSVSWIRAFSCPTPTEINEIAKLYPNIPEFLLLTQVERIVTEGNMPPHIIIDYLTKYTFMLSPGKTDFLLDLYNYKIAAINSSNQNQINEQLKIQMP